MAAEPFFGIDPYHVTLAIIGTVVVLAHWLPRMVSSREPAAAPLMIAFGAGAALLFPDIVTLPDPRTHPRPWELLSELTVLIALFGAGLRIDDLRDWARWTPTLRLLLVAMPLTIAAVAVLGVVWGELTAAGGVLLGAVLAPTDPVLAGDVQVGRPGEGGEHPVRFTLTTEAALNDGLAFPFVHMGVLIAASGLAVQGWGWEWITQDVIYRIGVGAAVGWVVARVLARLLFQTPRASVLAETESGVMALAGVLLCYGLAELAEGYGFIAVAMLGLTLRRIEPDHTYHTKLHDFAESLEHALTAVLLLALGVAIPTLFADLNWAQVGIAFVLLVVVRPLAGMVSLWRAGLGPRDRAVVSVYGVRGIGSIYYLCYAGSHMEFINESDLWSLVAFVILMSTILHGFTVGMAMRRIETEED